MPYQFKFLNGSIITCNDDGYRIHIKSIDGERWTEYDYKSKRVITRSLNGIGAGWHYDWPKFSWNK